MDQLKNAFKDIIAEGDSEILIADGFDDAILGYVERLGENGYQTYALYDKEKVIKMLENDMTREEAVEYFEYNILGAYVGEYTPAFATILNMEEGECT